MFHICMYIYTYTQAVVEVVERVKTAKVKREILPFAKVLTFMLFRLLVGLFWTANRYSAC